MIKTSSFAACLSDYGMAYALVEAACIMLLLGGIDVMLDMLYYVIICDVLAIGLQLPFGWLLRYLFK